MRTRNEARTASTPAAPKVEVDRGVAFVKCPKCGLNGSVGTAEKLEDGGLACAACGERLGDVREVAEAALNEARKQRAEAAPPVAMSNPASLEPAKPALRSRAEVAAAKKAPAPETGFRQPEAAVAAKLEAAADEWAPKERPKAELPDEPDPWGLNSRKVAEVARPKTLVEQDEENEMAARAAREEWFSELPVLKSYCEVCGELQRMSANGVTCRNGHGGANSVGPITVNQQNAKAVIADAAKKITDATLESRKKLAEAARSIPAEISAIGPVQRESPPGRGSLVEEVARRDGGEDVGEAVSAEWGAITVEINRFNSFRVGPFASSTTVRPGETRKHALARLLRDLADVADNETTRKRDWFIKRLFSTKEAVTRAGGSVE